MKNAKAYVITILSLIIFCGIAWWLFGSYIEFQKPQLSFPQGITTIGRQKVIGVTIADGISGIREMEISLSQGDRSVVLQKTRFPQRGVRKKFIPLLVDPYALKFQNGPARLTVSATDYSLLKNRTIAIQHLTIDMTPAQISPLNPVNYFNPGGTGVATFQTSKPVSVGGVWVGSTFTQGYPITLSGKPCMICYFALPLDAKQGVTSIRIAVRDEAGNESSSSLPGQIRIKQFRSDTMVLADSFLQQKMTDFQTMEPTLRGKTPVETFIAVNASMREGNTRTIQAICQKTIAKQLWQETFLRMKNASPMASFGDRRTYIYEGKAVGESVHQGVDLASTTHAPVEAANNGIVAYSGNLGIYGNTVMIDHGFGLFSLYGHLSSIAVKNGQTVIKGDVIGHTGLSGLAGGDHLHFSLIAGGQFVNPQEWWDPHWIEDNVNTKMKVSF